MREDSFSTTTQLHLVDETGKYGTTYLEASGGDVNAFVRFSQPTNTILVPIKLLPAVTFPYQGPPITEVPKEFRPRN